jgi:GNAT superfamily N-acetyltransferase
VDPSVAEIDKLCYYEKMRKNICIGEKSVAMYDDESGELIAKAKEIIPSHNSLEVTPKFRGQNIATEILDILEGYTGEKIKERAGKTTTVLFYLKRGFVPYKKILTDQRKCFIQENIEIEDFTEKEKVEILSLVKQSFNDKKEQVLPFAITLRKDKKEAEIYKMFLKRNLKKVTT